MLSHKKSSQNIWDILWKRKDSVDIHKELIDKILLYSPGKKILEIGFGTGGDLTQLSKLGFNCTGIETSRIAIRNAKNRFSKNISLIYADAHKIPISNETFDVVYHQGVMEHFKNPSNFLFEQRRILKNNGIVVIDVPHKWNLYTIYKQFLLLLGKWYGGWETSYSSKKLQSILNKTGFDLIEVDYRGIWPHQWGKFIYPERISDDKWVKTLISSPFIKQLSDICRKAYESLLFVKIISSYNIIIVAKKRPLKIAIDARYAENVGGGINNYITELVNYLKSSNIQVDVYSTKSLLNKFPKTKNIVIQNSFHWFIWEQIQLPLALNKRLPDIYHAAGNYGVPFIHNFRVILTIHDVIPKIFPNYFQKSKIPFLSKLLYYMRLQIGISIADRIICNSQNTALQVKNNFRVDVRKIKIIPMGINQEFLKISNLNNKMAWNIIGINKPYILNHGGIEYRKNNLRLLDAFVKARKIHNRIKDWILVFTGGEPSLVAELNKISTKHGISDKVKFIGWRNRSELAVLVKNAEIVVYPSLAEGFGMPLLEAMACGVPIVASDIPVLREFGENVPIYVNALNIDSISKGLIQASEGISSDRINKGKILAKQYTWDRVLSKTLETYDV